MKTAVLSLSAIALLTACGGSGDGSSSNPVTPPPSVTTLKTYTDGTGILTATTNLGNAGGMANLLVAADDINAASQVASGTVNLVEIPGTSGTNGQYYVVSRTGTSSNGTSIVVATAGESLNNSGSEYASIGIVAIGNGGGIMSGGSPVNGIPTGSYTYTGPASVVSLNGVGDGTFTMTANFNNNTGTIAATIPANTPAGSGNPSFFFASNNLSINQTNGSFSSNNATIGTTGITSEAATVYGYFAGTNAAGVHGLVYTNGTNALDYAGAFYGSR